MKTLMIAVTILFALSACGLMDRGEASMTGYSDHCIDGVEYIQFLNGATVKYNVDSTVATC